MFCDKFGYRILTVFQIAKRESRVSWQKSAIFSNEIYPGARGEPRLPPEVYKIIVDAIQATQLGGVNPQDAAAAASTQLDAFLATYSGAPML